MAGYGRTVFCINDMIIITQSFRSDIVVSYCFFKWTRVGNNWTGPCVVSSEPRWLFIRSGIPPYNLCVLRMRKHAQFQKYIPQRKTKVFPCTTQSNLRTCLLLEQVWTLSVPNAQEWPYLFAINDHYYSLFVNLLTCNGTYIQYTWMNDDITRLPRESAPHRTLDGRYILASHQGTHLTGRMWKSGLDVVCLGGVVEFKPISSKPISMRRRHTESRSYKIFSLYGIFIGRLEILFFCNLVADADTIIQRVPTNQSKYHESTFLSTGHA